MISSESNFIQNIELNQSAEIKKVDPNLKVDLNLLSPEEEFNFKKQNYPKVPFKSKKNNKQDLV